MSQLPQRTIDVHHDQVKAIMKNDRWNTSNAKAYNRYRLISRSRCWQKLLQNELSEVPTGNTILEVGAGTGFITGILAKMGYHVVATDLSPSMLTLAEHNLKRAGVAQQVRLVQNDAESLDLENNSFAAIVSRWLLWTLPRPEKALSEMARTLAPGGKLIVIDGQHQNIKLLARWRASLFDLFLTGRHPGWRPSTYKDVMATLPRINSFQVETVLLNIGLKEVRSCPLSDKEGDGHLMNWLTGYSWKSYLASGVKPKQT